VQPSASNRQPPAAIVLDSIAKRIIEELQADGRRSYAAIAKIVGLSEAAVRQRIQRLLEAGVMQIVAVTNPLTLGFQRQAMIGVRADGDLREVADRLAALDAVDYVVVTAGSFDILVELVAEDDEHLLRVLNEQIREVPGVRDTETFVYLRLTKQTYSWGTR
jgi:Lrp/AsnC family transcriptional regulator for asnA, asnC and gidA